jgi:tetratricopeptide (TPR) repeat protein
MQTNTVIEDNGILYSKSKYEKILETYEEELQHNPKNSAIYLKKGNLLVALGRPEEGLASYFMALEIDTARVGLDLQNILTKNSIPRYNHCNRV